MLAPGSYSACAQRNDFVFQGALHSASWPLFFCWHISRITLAPNSDVCVVSVRDGQSIGALAQHGGLPWHTVAQCGRFYSVLLLLCGCGWKTTDSQGGISSTGMSDMIGCDTTCLLCFRSEMNGAVVSAVVVVAGMV